MISLNPRNVDMTLGTQAHKTGMDIKRLLVINHKDIFFLDIYF